MTYLRNYLLIGLFPLFTFVIACSPSILPPLQSDVPPAKEKWNDVTFEQLSQGYKLYTTKCGKCHYLHKPDKFSEGKWREGIEMVQDKAKIDSLQKELIIRYLLISKETHSYLKDK
ncbi:MAG: hypothetical protein HYY40_08225 [Bacteroidetes bacterium]|nr:hypothetical protein [Bacteroidota bacterium]